MPKCNPRAISFICTQTYMHTISAHTYTCTHYLHIHTHAHIVCTYIHMHTLSAHTYTCTHCLHIHTHAHIFCTYMHMHILSGVMGYKTTNPGSWIHLLVCLIKIETNSCGFVLWIVCRSTYYMGFPQQLMTWMRMLLYRLPHVSCCV